MNRKRMTAKQKYLSLALTLICAFVGYGFYSMNHHRDALNAVIFSIALMGITLSVIRNSKI